MVQESSVPVDVVSIADGLRQVADLFEKHPADDGGLKYPDQGVSVSVVAASREAVHVWAAVLQHPVQAYVGEAEVHTYLDVRVGAVTVRVSHVEKLPREVRRPVDVTDRIEAQL